MCLTGGKNWAFQGYSNLQPFWQACHETGKQLKTLATKIKLNKQFLFGSFSLARMSYTASCRTFLRDVIATIVKPLLNGMCLYEWSIVWLCRCLSDSLVPKVLEDMSCYVFGKRNSRTLTLTKPPLTGLNLAPNYEGLQ